MRNKVIVIHGWTRCGKDTVAKMFKKEFEAKNKTVKIIPYAGLLKNFVSNMLSINKDDLEDLKEDELVIKEKACGITFRDFIILAAKALKEEVDEKIFMTEYKKEINDYDVIIIPDLRFKEEAEDLKEFEKANPDIDVVVIRLESKLKSCYRNLKSDQMFSIAYDYVIINEEDKLDELHEQVRKIANNV